MSYDLHFYKRRNSSLTEESFADYPARNLKFKSVRSRDNGFTKIRKQEFISGLTGMNPTPKLKMFKLFDSLEEFESK